MHVLVPLPSRDFDPSEVAVPWQILSDAGHRVSFATPDGQPGVADPVMLSGRGLDPWGLIPGLRRLSALGLLLRANEDARQAYRALQDDAAFRAPCAWAALRAAHYDALLLPGGHAAGVREYLESALLQALVAAFFSAAKPVAAICHGVVLAARSRAPGRRHSVLYGRRTTALTWSLESAAWQLTRRVGRWWDADYYRTYRERPGEPPGYRSVQQEVMRALARPEDFLDVPSDAPNRWRKTSGLCRDTVTDARAAFVVRDGDYVSARWPGDVHTFAKIFADVLAERAV